MPPGRPRAARCCKTVEDISTPRKAHRTHAQQTVYWRCIVLNRNSYCRATVIEQHGQFQHGVHQHVHPPRAGHMVARLVSVKVNGLAYYGRPMKYGGHYIFALSLLAFFLVSDIAIFVLKRDVKLQLTSLLSFSLSFILYIFFSSPNDSTRRLDVYHTSTHAKKSPKIAICTPCGRQPNFAALNRGHHLHSAGRPSRWTSAHVLVCT